MITLTIKTNNPIAEIGLWQDSHKMIDVTWEAHRQLADTIHSKIKILLEQQKLSIADIDNIVVFKGPGSFTGLRIGASVANALALGLAIPLKGESGHDWVQKGIESLQLGANDFVVTPDYGSEATITQPKK